MQTGQEAFSFGPFRLELNNRVLVHGDEALRIGSRALELLIHLVENAGRFVTQNELKLRAWPGIEVSETRVRASIEALRRALAARSPKEQYIIDMPGRGYCFIAPVSNLGNSAASSPAFVRYPFDPSQDLIGRLDAVTQILDMLRAHRFVSIVGAGGLGKTTLAIAVAHKMARASNFRICFVELSALSDPSQILNTVAYELGVELASSAGPETLAASLMGERLLLVLDNCEHLLEAAGHLSETLFRSVPGLHLIVTSRETMRIAGEHVHRLAPLECPSMQQEIASLSEVMRFPAARLFAQKAIAARGGSELADTDALPIAMICSRLDGIPLALEIAAARADMFEIAAIANRLDAKTALVARRRRSLQPRHRTMQSTLDWSYELLDREERSLLRHLSVFSGFFDFDGVVAVAGAASQMPETAARLTNLVRKSLVVSWGDGGSGYRLLETTRAYTREKLSEEGETTDAFRKYAHHILDRMKRARSDWGSRPVPDIVREFRLYLDGLREILDWCFLRKDEDELLFNLALSAVPLFLSSALIAECQQLVDRVRRRIAQSEDVDARLGLELSAAIATAQVFSGAGPGELSSSWSRILTEAQSLDHAETEIRALWGLCFSEDSDRLAPAERLLAVARTRSEKMVAAQWIGLAHSMKGNFAVAEQYLKQALSDEKEFGFHPSQALVRTQNKPFVQICLARLFWITGRVEQSISLIDEVSNYIIGNNYTMMLCPTIGSGSCPIYLWSGNIDVLSSFVRVLQNSAKRHALPWWTLMAAAYNGLVQIKAGDSSRGVELLADSVVRLEASFSHHPMAEFYIYLAEAMGDAGDPAGGLRVISSAFSRFAQGKEEWLAAEASRVKGNLICLAGGFKESLDVYDCFEDAIRIARQQGALSWQLRAAYCYARVLKDHGRIDRAVEILAPVYSQFSEGFNTADLRAAERLLGELGSSKLAKNSY